MKILALATLKGGSGKTINTFNIAGILAENHKVLLIDDDAQCNLTSNCGISSKIDDSLTIREMFEPQSMQPKIEKIIFKHPIEELPNLDIIPSSINLFKTEEQIAGRANKERILELYFKRNIKALMKYDYIFFDTNPSMSTINLNAYTVADAIILSSDISINSIKGAELFCSLWKDKRNDLDIEDNVSALIICNENKKTNISKEYNLYAYQESTVKDLILKTSIPSSVKIKNLELESKPINILYPNDKITALYREVVNELYEREVF